MMGVIDKPLIPDEVGRAWAEVDLAALAFNAAQLRSAMQPGCGLMAVVKADAYGHGAQRVAGRLQDEGVESFAVATVWEGVGLRKSGIEGEVLVLGYTGGADAALLKEFGLTQLVIDGAHAKALDGAGCDIRVHIAIDTGMHREGILASDIDEIESVFGYGHLAVEGLSTHLASSDSLDPDDVRFTNGQIGRFLSAADALRGKGRCVGKLHAQASYGLMNYPDAGFDYVRAGIALYGVMSHNGATRAKLDLRPVLSLKAIVAQVRWIDAGESISYGRTFTAEKPLKLATVCIGYADGVPRHMSGGGGACLIRGKKAPIIGRICMDMLLADVTGIDGAAPGDVATLIGRDGGEEIRCEDFAEAAGTISNDVLCRLGSRLPRLYKE